MKNILLLFFTLMLCANANGQASSTVGLELQVYPTGILPGIFLEHSLTGNSSLYVRVGANIFDHRDLGVQDIETGSGYGFSLGYKRFFKKENHGLRWGLKNDFWWNTVDWVDIVDQNVPGNVFNFEGISEIFVLQPTAELSYVLKHEKLLIAPSIAFGMEWNVKTEGAPTGQGAILLLGIQLGYRL